MANLIQSEIGTLPTNWSINRVDQLFDIQQGKSVSKANRKGNNQRSFLRTKNIYWGRIDFSELDRMHFTDSEEDRLRLQMGDLLLCEGGDVGRTAIWQAQLTDCYYQNHLHRLRAKSSDEIDMQFALFWFWYAFEVGHLYSGRSNITTIPNLSQSRLSEFQIPKPPLSEQRNIVEFLTRVQNSINHQDQLISLTHELKSALMRKLFTEGLRGEKQKTTEVGLVPESWKIVKFAGAVEIKTGQVDPKEAPYNNMLHVGPENIERDTGRFLSLHTNKELKIRSGNYYFNGDDILYSKIRPYLNKVAMPEFEGTCSADMYPLKPKTGTFTKSYLFQLLLSNIFLGQAISHQDRTGIPKINRNQLGLILLPKPTLDEQIEIAEILSSIDKKISSVEQRHLLLIEFFRNLLHQLMTGQIRVNDIDHPNIS